MFIYDDDDDFVDRVASFLGPGTEDGEAGLAVLGQDKWALLREALGEASRRIRHLDHDSIYSRPLATLAGYDLLLGQALERGAPALRLVGELPVSASEEQCDAWTLYEAVINPAFADRPVSILCGYDVREQPAEAVERAWETHPRALLDGWEDNPRYRDPAVVVSAMTPCPEVLPDLRELPVDADVSAFAERLRRELAALKLPRARAENLLLAAVAIFDNAMAHGRGARCQRIGRVAEQVVWELSDNGPGIDDPLAGYLPPREDATGRGLWSARQLTAEVQLLSSPQGLTVRLWI